MAYPIQDALINVNGEILTPEKAKVSVFDRSYLYGDSLYEVVRTYWGNFFKLDEHLERLQKSAELAQMALSKPLSFYRDEILRTTRAYRAQKGRENTDVYMRVVLSRGTGKIGFGLKNIFEPFTYTIYVFSIEGLAPTPETFKKGLSIQISSRLRNDQRALDPAMKSGNYMNSVLAYLSAAEAGFDDAIMCNADGHITEGTTFNIWYVKRGILVTPPFEIGMLDGITRREILGLTQALHLSVRTTRFPKERLYEADEVFLSGSFKEIFPINRIDDRKFKTPGEITSKLAKAYKDLVKRTLS